jgi:hypothetical protein
VVANVPAWIRISLILAAFLGSWPHGEAAERSASLDGYWSGWAERDGVSSQVALRLITGGGELTGTVDWPAMGYFRTDLIGARIDGSNVAFSVPLPVGALKLLGALQADTINGTLEPIVLVHGEWQSLGKGGAFELRRVAEPSVPYVIEEATFQSGDATIAGSIFLPLDKTPRPGVVFVAGSGDTTRGDGAFLADRLARAGIAALVYDKRGAGRSTGNWRQGGFEELAADATEALKLLQHRPGIQQGRTGFVCQSQGCWVVPVALRNGAPAHFAVMQSGPAVSVAEEDLDFYSVTLTSQGFGPLEIEEAFALVRISHQVILGSATPAGLEAAIANCQDRAWFKELGFSPSPVDDPERAFERRTLAYDPAIDIDAIHIPSLWIYGDADTIIPVQASLDRVGQAKSSPRPEIKVLRDAGHSFTVGKSTIPRLADEYPGLVIEWIKNRH